MAQQLAQRGVRTPVIVPAGACNGEPLWQQLCRAMSEPSTEAKAGSQLGSQSDSEAASPSLSKDLLHDLLASGCLTVIIDGEFWCLLFVLAHQLTTLCQG